MVSDCYVTDFSMSELNEGRLAPETFVDLSKIRNESLCT